MVDSIKNSMNRIDVQRTRGNDIDTKPGANSSATSKGLASDKISIDTSKLETSEKAQTTIKELLLEERIVELAKMLSGKTITDSSLSNARDLLNTW